ncbi:MAG TPA: HU family DNA-binding protein [Phycisphaerae bacterium]|nr:HU family DNA-binding protein [Phycisphaerae bacterium]
MATITKKDLVDRIAAKRKLRRHEVKQIIQDFLDEIVTELLRNNRLEFRDFGVFESRQRAARVAQNPKTLHRVPVPSKRKVRFKPGHMLKTKLSAPAKASTVEVKKTVLTGQHVAASPPPPA